MQKECESNLEWSPENKLYKDTSFLMDDVV